MAHWTPTDIPDLSGRTAVVTGANCGLGYETAKALAEHGATVVMACRDKDRCREAIRRLLTAVPSACVQPADLDLANLAAPLWAVSQELTGVDLDAALTAAVG
jgi:NAD(P)-dependent dehydrogenase (short-subunit alcohol dehydrogenase family)